MMLVPCYAELICCLTLLDKETTARLIGTALLAKKTGGAQGSLSCCSKNERNRDRMTLLGSPNSGDVWYPFGTRSHPPNHGTLALPWQTVKPPEKSQATELRPVMGLPGMSCSSTRERAFPGLIPGDVSSGE